MPNEEMPLVKPEELLAAFWEWNKTLDADFIPSQKERFIKVTEIQRDADLAILRAERIEAYQRGWEDAEVSYNFKVIPKLLEAERLKEAEWLGVFNAHRRYLPDAELEMDAHIASLKGDGEGCLNK